MKLKAVGGASESTMTKLIGQERAEAVRRLRPIFEKEMLNGLKLLPGQLNKSVMREILELQY